MTQLLGRAQINKAVIFGIIGYGWRFLAGPVTMALIATRFSAEVQGYYYTFSSLLALQVFVELGLAGVITQFASHEWAKLRLENGRIRGDANGLSRLVSLGRMALSWYFVAGAVVAAWLAVWGFYFFSSSSTAGVHWQGPWIALCIAAGVNLCFVAIFALLEGCNQVANVYGFRMFQSVLTCISLWTGILLGAELWTASISMVVGILAAVVFLLIRYRTFFLSFLSAPTGARIRWRTDVLPMQWKTAVSYVAGYFTMWVFTPVLFHYHGAVVAGQFGMTWNLAFCAASLASVWSGPRAPEFGMLAAKKDYAALDGLLRRVWTMSALVLVAGSAAVWFLIYLTAAVNHPFAARNVSPACAGLLAVGRIAANVCDSTAVYLRAHKREPFMIYFLVLGLLTAVLGWLFGRRFGVIGVAAAFAGINVLVACPWGLWIWHRCRSKWHAAVPS